MRTFEPTNITCNILQSANNTLIFEGGWEGIPQTIVFNLVICSVCILIFVLLRKQAWSRKSRHLTRTRKGWLQFIYGDRDAPEFNISPHAATTSHHVHDFLHANVIFPPSLNLNTSDTIASVSLNRVTIEESEEEDDNRSITTEHSHMEGNGNNGTNDINIDINQAHTHNLIGHNNGQNGDTVWRVKSSTVPSNALDDEEESRRKADFQTAKSRLERSNSTESANAYGIWFLNVLFIKDKDILQRKGSDAMQYLIFQRYIIYFLTLLTFICIGIILPINMQGIFDSKPFGKTTINNLPGSSNLLWVHAILSALILPIGVYMMHHFSKVIKADEDQVARRTLLIRRVPKNKRSKEDLVIYFNNTLPGVILEGIQFVYDIRKLNQLEQDYKNAVNAKLYCHDYLTDYSERCEVRPYFMGQFGGICCCCACCPKVDGIQFYTDKERELEKDIKHELGNTVSAPSGSTFVTFQTEKMAMEVYKYLRERQTVCSWCCNCFIPGAESWISRNLHNNQSDPLETNRWLVSYAPYPNDINWKDLAVNYRMVWLRKTGVHIMLFIIFFFLSTPAFLLKIFEYVKLTQAIQEGLGTISSTFTDYLSPLLLLLMTVVLPAIVIFACELIPYKTISELNHAIMWKVFCFLLMMVIILPSAGFASTNALFEGILNRNSSHQFRWECLFPVDSGAFFVNYVCQAAFLGNTMELMRFPELILYLIFTIIARSPAEYESARQQILFDFSFGVRYPRFLLIFAMVTTYSLSCPLIAPCGLVYMVCKHLVDRYNIYYVYYPSKINGRIHSTAVLYIHIALIMMQFQVFTFLLMRTGYTQVTGFSMIVLIIALLVFAGHCFFHWFRNINHLTYTATTRLTRKVRKHEYCACTYFPPVFNALITQRIIKKDYFTSRYKRTGANENMPSSSRERLNL